MGYYDKSKFVGEMRWYPVVHKIMYDVKVDDILFNGKTIGLCKYPHNCTLTFDSGSTYMNVPSYAAEMMQHHGIPVQNALPCRKSEDFGNITFILNGERYDMDSDDFMRDPEPVLFQSSGAQTPSKGNSSLECKANILTVNVAENMFMVGDRFMRKFYTVFDRDNSRVGLARSSLFG